MSKSRSVRSEGAVSVLSFNASLYLLKQSNPQPSLLSNKWISARRPLDPLPTPNCENTASVRQIKDIDGSTASSKPSTSKAKRKGTQSTIDSFFGPGQSNRAPKPRDSRRRQTYPADLKNHEVHQAQREIIISPLSSPIRLDTSSDDLPPVCDREPAAKKRRTSLPCSPFSDFHPEPLTPLSPPFSPPASFGALEDDTQMRNEPLTFSNLMNDVAKSPFRSKTRESSVATDTFESVYSQEPPQFSPALDTIPANYSPPSSSGHTSNTSEFDSPPPDSDNQFHPTMQTIPADYTPPKLRSRLKSEPAESIGESVVSEGGEGRVFEPIGDTIPADYYRSSQYASRERKAVKSSPDPRRTPGRMAALEEALVAANDDDDEIESVDDPSARSFHAALETIPADYACTRTMEVPPGGGKEEEETQGGGVLVRHRDGALPSRIPSSARARIDRIREGFEGARIKIAPRQTTLLGMWDATVSREPRPSLSSSSTETEMASEAAALVRHLRSRQEEKQQPSSFHRQQGVEDAEDDIVDLEQDNDSKQPEMQDALIVVPSSQTQCGSPLGSEANLPNDMNDDKKEEEEEDDDEENIVIPSSSQPTSPEESTTQFVISSQTQVFERLDSFENNNPVQAVVESSQTQFVPSFAEEEW
jgi:hypothetical protein